MKVLGDGLAGKAAAFLRGLGWAVEQGFDVVNLSLGTNRRDWALPFYELCDQAYFPGLLVVTAANNVTRAELPVAVRLGDERRVQPVDRSRCASTTTRSRRPSSSPAASTSTWRGSTTGQITSDG